MNYEKIAQNELRVLHQNAKISSQNLKYFHEFHKQYDVSPARKSIFYRAMVKIFQYSKDFKTEMHSREQMNILHKKIRDEGNSESVNQTIMSCARTLAIWLNEGTKPKGFVDISFHKKKYKRKLQSKDMISWEDILEVCKKTNSVQLQAILTTLLDGSFRPSEFVNLKYGDIDASNKPFIDIEVTGKTGTRSAWCYRATPYLERWLNAHPTKKANDSLWIIETPYQSRRKNNKTKNNKYEYPAIQKRIKTLFKIAKINKPCDFYNFRHSGAILMALDGVPVENRASKMGHSIEMHVETYGRWDKEKEKKVIRGVFGIEHTNEKSKPLLCEFCKTTNEPKQEYCVQCNNPLTAEVALRDKQKEQDRFKILEERMKKLEIMQQLDASLTANLIKK